MDSYSRRVKYLKVLLPLAALAILSTLFLLSQSVNPNQTIPFSDAEIAERIRDQQITAPRFAGTTASGDEVFLSATKAIPGGSGSPGEAENLHGEIRMARGGVITFESERGWINVPDDAAFFRGGVTVVTDTGYQLVTDRLTTAVHRIEVIAPSPVSGTSPMGELEAGAMHLSAPGTDASEAHLVFTEGVKLLYDPKTNER